MELNFADRLMVGIGHITMSICDMITDMAIPVVIGVLLLVAVLAKELKLALGIVVITFLLSYYGIIMNIFGIPLYIAILVISGAICLFTLNVIIEGIDRLKVWYGCIHPDTRYFIEEAMKEVAWGALVAAIGVVGFVFAYLKLF